MGLFGTKDNCSICGGKPKGASKLRDGIICRECRILCSNGITDTLNLSVSDIKEHLQYRKENKERLNSFDATDSAGLYLKINAESKTFIVPNGDKKYMEHNVDVFNFSDVVDYEYVEDGETVSKGGIGAAVVGGAVFGGVGAIVGSNVGKKKSSTVVNSMYIRMSLQNKWVKQIKINLIYTETKKNGIIYNVCKQAADKIASLLDFIVKQSTSVIPPMQTTESSADEILKFKNLFDTGIITQEEFDAKKKQLLGLWLYFYNLLTNLENSMGNKHKWILRALSIFW